MSNRVAAVPSFKQKLPLLPVFLLFATVLKCKWCSLSFPLLSEWFCIIASQVSSRPLSPLTPVKQVRLLKVLGVTLQWHELRIKPAVSNLPVLWLETWLLVAVQLFLSHGCAFWMASDDNYLWLLALEAAEEEISVCLWASFHAWSLCMQVQKDYQKVSWGLKLEILLFRNLLKGETWHLCIVSLSGARKWQQLHQHSGYSLHVLFKQDWQPWLYFLKSKRKNSDFLLCNC